MCVIVYKPSGIELPSKEVIKRCWNKNPDGAGYMFAKYNYVNIKKGYFDFETFYKDLKKDYEKNNLKNQNLILHFRIGTSGGINKEKTHPFPLSDNDELLNKTRLKSKWAIAHNGILSKYVDLTDKLSDTQNFSKRFLTPFLKMINYNVNNELVKDIIEKELGGDRLVLMNRRGKVYIYGKWEKANDVFYSNGSYKDYSSYYSYYGKSYDTPTGWTNLYNDTYLDEDFEMGEEEYEYITSSCQKVSDNQKVIFSDGFEFIPKDFETFTYYIDDSGNLYEINEKQQTYSLIDVGAVVVPIKS